MREVWSFRVICVTCDPPTASLTEWSRADWESSSQSRIVAVRGGREFSACIIAKKWVSEKSSARFALLIIIRSLICVIAMLADGDFAL